MAESDIRQKLIMAGVRNLKEFGYPNVDSANILTDYVFRQFFLSMLEDEENDRLPQQAQQVRRTLIDELK
jgi:hypothetical protein